MNRNFFIDTERIRCQPFIKDDIDSFNGIIKVDPEVRRFFTFGSLLSFFGGSMSMTVAPWLSIAICLACPLSIPR